MNIVYTVEGNLDFYGELYKSLDEDDDVEDESVKRCLITNEPLIENFVTMDCKHSFNYLPLFQDIFNNKKKFNAMDSYMLKCGEIRCPYCRTIQKKLLPYYENMGVKQVHGVNFFDELQVIKKQVQTDSYVTGKCDYIYGNTNVECSNKYVQILPQLNKYFCCMHKSVALKKHIKDEKLKILKQKADEKLALKEAAANAKKDAKHVKQLAKQALTNAVVTLNNNTIVLGCTQILKSGAKKGSPCCAKVSKDGMCMRHFNLLSKKEVLVVEGPVGNIEESTIFYPLGSTGIPQNSICLESNVIHPLGSTGIPQPSV